ARSVRRGLRRRERPAVKYSVQRVLERLAGLELRRLRCGDLDRLAGLGIASGARLPCGNGERAEARDVDLVAVTKRGDDVVEDGVDRPLGLPLRQIQLAGHRLDQVGLGHAPSPCPASAPAALATDPWAVNYGRARVSASRRR